MEDNGADRPRDLHPLIWVGLPTGSLLICWLSPLLGYARWKALMMGETGFIELATVALLVPGIGASVLIFLRRRGLPRGVRRVMLLAGLAALYFAGEEIDWGQHWLGYATPLVLARINCQQEFNLHNIRGGSLFNNVPRQAMLWWCVFGGLLAPLVLRRRRKPSAGSTWGWLVPTHVLVPISLIAALSTVPEKIYDKFLKASWPLARDGYAYMAFIDQAGEFKEYCYAMAMTFFVLSVYLRSRPERLAGRG